MKALLDIYLRRIPYNIVQVEYTVLPPCAAHFHTIPNTTIKLYVSRSSTYIIRYDLVEKIKLCPM